MQRTDPPVPPLLRVGALVVNFNTARLTLQAVRSLVDQTRPTHVVALDNGSEPSDLAILAKGLPPCVELLRSERNLGFAAGCNLGIAHLLAREDVDAIVLLNSDAVSMPDLVDTMCSAAESNSNLDLLGAPLHRMDEPELVDSLGIVFYASLIASNRLDARSPFFGPTGGCAFYSRRLLEDLHASHGYVFDPDFFCYAEDTDLAARAILLGYQAGFVGSTIALHQGQASSGGADSTFVLYHGIRNSIWTMIKNVPTAPLLLRFPLVLAMHCGIALRHARKGHLAVIFRLYRDALRGLPGMLTKRRIIQATRRVSAAAFSRRLSRHFYEPRMVRDALSQLFGGRAKLRPERSRQEVD